MHHNTHVIGMILENHNNTFDLINRIDNKVTNYVDGNLARLLINRY